MTRFGNRIARYANVYGVQIIISYYEPLNDSDYFWFDGYADVFEALRESYQ